MAEEPTITCPECGAEIKLTESLAAPILSAAKADFAEKLKDQRKTIAEEETKKAREAIKDELESKGKELKEAQELIDQKNEKLAEAQNAQAELLQAYRADRRPLIEASWARLRALDISEDQMTALVETGEIAELVKFFAPQDGVVAELNVAQGMYVKPSTSIMTLADLSAVWLLADVFERQSGWIALDQPAEVRLSYLPGRLWRGQVEYIYPALDPKTRSLKVRLEFEAGFDLICAAQHYLAAPYQMSTTMPLLARLAAEAGDMEVAATIILLPLHNPVEIADSVATLDAICGGRFIFGIGLGFRA